MIKKLELTFGMFYFNCFIILSIFQLEGKAETRIIAKSGDNLINISRRYGVPLKELMYKNNFNDATKIIEGEIILIPHKKNNKDKKNKYLTYKVIEGDTLYKIARNHNININDIISINNLKNISSIAPSQIILLPKEAKYNKVISTGNIKFARKKVFYHKTSNIENLSNIVKIHKISTEEINTLNKLNYPTKISPNIKLRIRENKPTKWLKYGPIIINWSDWTYFDGNYIAQAKTKKNTSFHIALSCNKRVINNSLNNSYWTSWYFPKTDFEFKLINDFCDRDFKF